MLQYSAVLELVLSIFKKFHLEAFCSLQTTSTRIFTAPVVCHQKYVLLLEEKNSLGCPWGKEVCTSCRFYLPKSRKDSMIGSQKAVEIEFGISASRVVIVLAGYRQRHSILDL